MTGDSRPWTCVLCEGDRDCPGTVVLRLDGDQSSLVIYTEEDGMIRQYGCSVSALMGAQRGLRTHLMSQSGQCTLEKDDNAILVKLETRDDKQFVFRVPKAEYANSLSRMAEVKAAHGRFRFY